MSNPLLELIAENRAGTGIAMPSICSAQPGVILASALLAAEKGQVLLLEATSNQVNQDGGYTGMKPDDFVGYVKGICAEAGLPDTSLLLGGDHLGPQAWRTMPADKAMAKSRDLMRAYVEAGFTKIHLDCSQGCVGEEAQVDDETSASRAAELAAVCEAYAPDPDKLSYIIGTEVPPPGGARKEDAHAIEPTPPARARATLLMHYQKFDELGLEAAKGRICALVVQPGVEFSPFHVDHLPTGEGKALRAILDPYKNVVFEAHSTDYQHDSAYPRLASMGFAIQKVGPALTFAYRQAIYALDQLLDWLEEDRRTAPKIPAVLEAEMLAQPTYWRSHYHGTDQELRLLRHFSYSDRVRYYWPQERVQSALKAVFASLATHTIPETLLLQLFASCVVKRARALQRHGFGIEKALVLAQIQQALDPYYFERVETPQLEETL
ncbi:D-tagatose-1,6-bisphosphate aldolase subunit KbaZ [Pseudovibrio axinellae]|uniref:D-tagatose-1,6-bisphosphate aldolase subunit KbaZ n=1 Tax=Pseudovibrio axinellae TaxID=989403 RepID=A0A165T507_9HYPH|nr:class II D-tagatose-bisphosphate aldolase, non-catalytic subunit [Pseudovibrio axinellae]KZL05439.1 D-tagatose-1,6-bisphosphate aldolase subunit KbaZ [Pseudovibrio axinellae]SEP99162.1 tagatose-bisphosphate aldolase noncatalytic subunit [Pseudovibrio axinellae]